MEEVFDPVPEITARHFEVAMRDARRSVSDQDLAKYSAFSATMQQQRAALNQAGGTLSGFQMPRSGGGAGAAPTAGGAGEEEDLYS